MGKWWSTYLLKYITEPVVLKPCGSVYVDFSGSDLGAVFICDEPTDHEGLHIDKVERVAWANHELRLRKAGSWTTGLVPPVPTDSQEEETR